MSVAPGSGEREETYSQTLARLSSAQKAAAPGAPLYSLLVNRRLGRYLAAAAFRRGLTPNAVTGISAVFTFAGIGVLALVPPMWWSGLTISVLLVIGYALDSADGQVARLRGGGSLEGEWLDHVIDSFKIASLHLAVLVMMFRYLEMTAGWFLVPVGFTVVASVGFFTMILNDQLKRVHALSSGLPPVPRPGRSTLARLALLPTDYGLLCIMFVLLAVPTVFVWVYTLVFVANALHLALALRKWRRDLRSLGQEGTVG